jgi:hypothetical protein
MNEVADSGAIPVTRLLGSAIGRRVIRVGAETIWLQQ